MSHELNPEATFPEFFVQVGTIGATQNQQSLRRLSLRQTLDGYSGFAMGAGRSQGAFRGFLSRKTTPRGLYQDTVAKPLYFYDPWMRRSSNPHARRLDLAKEADGLDHSYTCKPSFHKGCTV